LRVRVLVWRAVWRLVWTGAHGETVHLRHPFQPEKSPLETGKKKFQAEKRRQAEKSLLKKASKIIGLVPSAKKNVHALKKDVYRCMHHMFI
jgi:hypothetical protein